MPAERPNERLARWIVAEVLRPPVRRFEDGRRNAQVDAEIVLQDHRTGLEIVSDQDPVFNGQWAALEKIGHKVEVPGLERRWIVSLTRRAKIKDVVVGLPTLMLRLPSGEITWPRWGVPDEFERVGAISAHPIEDERSGVVHLTTEGWSGSAGESVLSPWIDEMFSRHPDVPHKLAAHPTADGHAFLWVTTSSDFAVQFALEDRGQGVPTDTPTLPEGVTHIWVAGSASSQGVVAWFPDGGWWRTPWQWSNRPPVIPDDF